MGEIGKIAMLGGDERQIYLARALAKRGRAVYAWGLGSDFDRICPAKAVQTPSEALDGASVVLLPMPASLDGKKLDIRLIVDRCSVELYADGGRFCGVFLTVRDLNLPYFSVSGKKNITVDSLKISKLGSIH